MNLRAAILKNLRKLEDVNFSKDFLNYLFV